MSGTAPEGVMDERQELWFDAVKDDPEMTDAGKVAALYECAADYWRKLEGVDAKEIGLLNEIAAREAEVARLTRQRDEVFDQAQRFSNEVARLTAIETAARKHLDAIKDERDLRLRCDDEGIKRATACEITVREYKRDYYAPTIRAQFAVAAARDELVAALAAPPPGDGAGGGEEL